MNETQELALRRVFDRTPLVPKITPTGNVMPMPLPEGSSIPPMSFDAFKMLACGLALSQMVIRIVNHFEGIGLILVPLMGLTPNNGEKND